MPTAFNDTRLMDDFAATLKSHGLILKGEMQSFTDLAPLISLYAITMLHFCRILDADGSTIQLRASRDHDGPIRVSAYVPTSFRGVNIFLGAPMFTTSFDVAPHCDANLLLASAEWEYELEVRPDKKLARLA